MQAKIRIVEALLAKARELGLSPVPEERIAAAELEIRLKKELAELRRHKARRPKAPAHAGQ
jgi:hypothetical protein